MPRMTATRRRRPRRAANAIASSGEAKCACGPGMAMQAQGLEAQWLEPTTHDGLVAGSRPAGPTKAPASARALPARSSPCGLPRPDLLMGGPR